MSGATDVLGNCGPYAAATLESHQHKTKLDRERQGSQNNQTFSRLYNLGSTLYAVKNGATVSCFIFCIYNLFKQL